MLLRSTVVIGLLVISAAPIAAQQCTAPGYAVQVSAADGAALDSAFLHDAARAVALRWATPSVRRDGFAMWRRVRERTLPDVPRWADDWRPSEHHKAVAIIVLRRRGRHEIGEPSPASGDRLFDRSLESIVQDPLPGSPEFPLLPSSVSADSVAIRVEFGAQPSALSAGIVRFASHQTNVRILPGSLNVTAPRREPFTVGGRVSPTVMEAPTATVKYDVAADGTIVPNSIQVVETSNREFGRSVQDALLRARFNAATTNCEPVRISVIQRIGN